MRTLQLITLSLGVFAVSMYASTITSTGTGGNWTATGTWVGGVVPGATDDVVIADGATVTINGSFTVASITVGQGTSGILKFDMTGTIRAIVVTGNITVNAGGNFNPGTGGTQTVHTMAIGGDIVNNGTFDMSLASTTRVCRVTFNKAGDQTISGTPTLTRFNGVTLDKGSVSNKVSSSLSHDINTGALFIFTAGTWEQTAGTLTIPGSNMTIAANGALSFTGSGSFSIPASSPTVAGSFSVNTSGTINIGGGNNTLSTSGGTITLTAGTVNIQGKLNLSAGNGTLIVNGATVNINPTGVVTATSHSFQIAGSSSFTFSSGTINILHALPTVGTGADISMSAATAPSVVSITGSAKFVLGSGGSTTGSADGFEITANSANSFQDLEINTNSIPVKTTSGAITVKGTLTLTSGNFGIGAQTVGGVASTNLNGILSLYNPIAGTATNLQNTLHSSAGTPLSSIRIFGTASGIQIPSSITRLSKLTIDNSSGVALSGNLSVDTTLTLTSGLLTLGANHLTLSDVATISGTPSASNMIVATGSGELRKSFSADASFTFPVGDNTGTAEYSPVNVNLTAGGYSSAYVGVKLSNAKESNNASGTDYLNRYWVLSSSGLTSPSYSATFTYVPADVAGTENNLIGGKYDGSWVVLNPVNDVAHTFTGSGLTTFSTFSAGETSSLPVELTSFSVKASQRSAELKWSTATELNNHGFEIERRSNGNWSKAGFVSGSGNSSSAKMYSYVDANLTAGRYEYRLKQIDNDGSFKYVGSVESAEVGAAAKVFGLSDNYPNPFNPATSIEFTVAKDGIAVLKVYNLIGQEVAALFSGAAQAGKINRVEFNAKDLPSGIYFSKLQVGNQQIVKKMMLMK